MSRKMNIYYNVLFGGAAGLIAWFILSVLPGLEEKGILIRVATKGAVVGMLLGGAVGSVEGLLDRSKRRVILGCATGVGLGLFGGALGLAIGEGFLKLIGGGIAGRTIGWAVFGSLVGLSQGLVARSPRKISYGGIGGFIGGLLGGVILESVVSGGNVGVKPWSVGVGLVVLGASIGMLIASVEEIFNTARLMILSGSQEGRQFNLTKNITRLGRDERCDIALQNDSMIAPEHIEVRRDSQGFALLILEAGVSINGATTMNAHRLQNRDRFRVGETEILFTQRSNIA